MGFWSEMRQGFAEARAAQFEQQSSPNEPELPPEHPEEPGPPPSGGGPGCEECAARDLAIEDLDRKIEESTSVIAELVAENERLTAALKAKKKERANSERGSAGEEKFRKLKTAVAKLTHPDTVASSNPLHATLTRIYQELRAEIDRIEGE